MDTMIQSYMEETEDMLQRAEECIIRLEMEYSPVDVNELFRIAHTIKGSSHMVGYEDIGNLMHKIEDMLDCARNGSILFDQSIVSLCFEGLDIVKKMLQCKKEAGSQEMMESLVNSSLRISEMVEVFLRVNKKEEKKTIVMQQEPGIVTSLLNKKSKGKNKYYITFFIEEDAPMISPVLIMILQSVEDIGTLVYSSVDDNYFSGSSSDSDIKTFEVIISTDIDEAELYTYFALFYVEKINILNISRSKLEENDYCFSNTGDTPYVVIIRAFMMLYNILFIKPEKSRANNEERCIIESLHCEIVNAFAGMKNKNKFNTFVKDFNEFYNLTLQIYDRQSGTDEKICANHLAQMVKLIERLYSEIRGKYIFYIFKSENDSFIHSLRNFTGMVNKSSTLIILVDISKLSILHENEVKDLIEIKKKLEVQDIEMNIISEGGNSRRMLNIFDSIKPVEEFKVFRTELDAILRMFQSEDSLQRISEKIMGTQIRWLNDTI